MSYNLYSINVYLCTSPVWVELAYDLPQVEKQEGYCSTQHGKQQKCIRSEKLHKWIHPTTCFSEDEKYPEEKKVFENNQPENIIDFDNNIPYSVAGAESKYSSKCWQVGGIGMKY